MKVLRNILLGLIFVLAAIAVGGYIYLQQTKPRYSGELKLAGLSSEVEVLFDTYGIPHIYADNEKDLYYALGYVHAQDRLFQMEMLRRVSGGKLAEILGPDLVDTDRFFRTLGFNQAAEESASTYFSNRAEPFQIMAQAYLDGVNAFMENGPTPPEFQLLGIPKEPFVPADLYRIASFMSFGFNAALRTDPLMSRIANQWGPAHLEDLALNTLPDNTMIPTYYARDSATISVVLNTAQMALSKVPIPLWEGSNSWVIAPEHTKSRKVIFANDTHIGFGQPAVWYEAHLECPGFSFYGNHLAGFPFALIGHNRFASWGLTIFPNDDMDFYREKPNPENPDEVMVNGKWEPLEKRQEIIRVKGQDDQILEVKISRHGPIINQVNDQIEAAESDPISFWWSYFLFPRQILQATYQFSHGTNIDQYREAASQINGPGLNVMYGDRDGNIAWWGVGKLVKRRDSTNAKMILDGASGKDDPSGWYDFSENPQSENPPSGLVYSANNQPDSAFGIMHAGYYFAGNRGERISNLLMEKTDWDLEAMKQVVLDDRSVEYPVVAAKVLDLLKINDKPGTAANELYKWEGNHNLKSVGPTIYYKLVYHIWRLATQDELGEEDFSTFLTTMVMKRSLPYLIDNDQARWWDNVQTEGKKESRLEIITQAWDQTMLELNEQLGQDPSQWHWEKVHTLEHEHALGQQKPLDKIFNVGPFPIAGGEAVINKMYFPLDPQGNYKVKSGPAMRILLDFGDLDHSLSVLPTGQSGHFMSPHYQDQAELYHSGGFRNQLMDREEIESVSENRLLLSPQK